MCDPYDTRGYYFYVPVLPELLTLPSPNGGVGRCFMGLRFIEECVGVLSDNSGPLMVGGNQIALNHRFYTFSVGTNSVHAIDGATTGDLQSFNFPVTVAPPPPVPLPGQPPLPAPHFTPELIFVVPQADGGYHLMNVPVRRHNTLVSVLCAASKQDLAKFKQTCFRMCREALGDIQSPQSDVSYYSLYMFSLATNSFEGHNRRGVTTMVDWTAVIDLKLMEMRVGPVKIKLFRSSLFFFLSVLLPGYFGGLHTTRCAYGLLTSNPVQDWIDTGAPYSLIYPDRYGSGFVGWVSSYL
jgi:hypothetical protein